MAKEAPEKAAMEAVGDKWSEMIGKWGEVE